MNLTDKIGYPIVVGDWIAYGHALGRCAGLRIGKVLKITERKAAWTRERTWSITVIGVNDDWSFKDPGVCSRVGTLMFPNRTIVLKPEQVPARYVELINEWETRRVPR